MPDWISWAWVKDLGLFSIAAYGAILSTFNWRQAIRRDTRRIVVRASTVMATYGAGLGPPWAQIEATNEGIRPVTINQLTFDLPGRKRMALMYPEQFPGRQSTSLPAIVTDSQTILTLISYAEIAAVLAGSGLSGTVKLIPIAIDSLGAEYRGKPWDVNISEFASMGWTPAASQRQ